MLLAAKADVDAADGSGMSPLHYAAMLGASDAAGLLLGAGADAALRDEDGASPLDMAEGEAMTELLTGRLGRADGPEPRASAGDVPASEEGEATATAIQRGEVRGEAEAQAALSSLVHGLQDGSRQLAERDPMSEYEGQVRDPPMSR